MMYRKLQLVLCGLFLVGLCIELNLIYTVRGTDGADNSVHRCKQRVSQALNRVKTKHRVCFTCTDEAPTPVAHEGDMCDRYKREGETERKFIGNILAGQADDADLVTLATQMSSDEIDELAKLAERWRGPISVSVHIDAFKIVSFLENSVCGSRILSSRTNINFHFVLAVGTLYPINELRNVALVGVTTEFVYLSDISLLPGKETEANINRRLQQHPMGKREAWVVPAFETDPAHDREYALVDKSDLLSGISMGFMRPLMSTTKKLAQNATNYSKWYSEKDPYKVEYEEDYEPYLVMRTRQVPRYDTRFLGLYRHKLSHVLEIFFNGFDFVVQPDVFTVKFGEKNGHILDVDPQLYLKCAMSEYAEFKRYLVEKYGDITYKSVSFKP